MDARLAALPIAEYAKEQLALRLGHLAAEWQRCLQSGDADAVHDLRVAIRRFDEALRVFKTLFPKAPRRQVHGELGQVLQLAGRVRDADIALECFALADVTVSAELALAIANERAAAEAALRAALATGQSTNFQQRWRMSLALHDEAAAPPAGAVL